MYESDITSRLLVVLIVMQFAEFRVEAFPNLDDHDQIVYHLAYMGTASSSIFSSVVLTDSLKP